MTESVISELTQSTIPHTTTHLEPERENHDTSWRTRPVVEVEVEQLNHTMESEITQSFLRHPTVFNSVFTQTEQRKAEPMSSMTQTESVHERISTSTQSGNSIGISSHHSAGHPTHSIRENHSYNSRVHVANQSKLRSSELQQEKKEDRYKKIHHESKTESSIPTTSNISQKKFAKIDKALRMLQYNTLLSTISTNTDDHCEEIDPNLIERECVSSDMIKVTNTIYKRFLLEAIEELSNNYDKEEQQDLLRKMEILRKKSHCLRKCNKKLQQE